MHYINTRFTYLLTDESFKVWWISNHQFSHHSHCRIRRQVVNCNAASALYLGARFYGALEMFLTLTLLQIYF